MYNKDKDYTLKYITKNGEEKTKEFTPDKDTSVPQVINMLKQEDKDFFKLIENKILKKEEKSVKTLYDVLDERDFEDIDIADNENGDLLVAFCLDPENGDSDSYDRVLTKIAKGLEVYEEQEDVIICKVTNWVEKHKEVLVDMFELYGEDESDVMEELVATDFPGIVSGYITDTAYNELDSKLTESKTINEDYNGAIEIFNKPYSNGNHEYNFIINEVQFSNWKTNHPNRIRPKMYAIKEDGKTILYTSLWQTWRKQIKDITGKDLKELSENINVLKESNGTDLAVEAIETFKQNGKIDVEWLNNDIELNIYNTKYLYDMAINPRRQAHTVAFTGLIETLNNRIGNDNLTGQQVKAGFSKLGLDYKEVLKPVVEYIEERRQEDLEENKEIKTENVNTNINDFLHFCNDENLEDNKKDSLNKYIKEYTKWRTRIKGIDGLEKETKQVEKDIQSYLDSAKEIKTEKVLTSSNGKFRKGDIYVNGQGAIIRIENYTNNGTPQYDIGMGTDFATGTYTCRGTNSDEDLQAILDNNGYRKINENKKVKTESKDLSVHNNEVWVNRNTVGYNTIGLIIDKENKQFQLLDAQRLPLGKYKKATKKAIREKADELEAMGYKEVVTDSSVSR